MTNRPKTLHYQRKAIMSIVDNQLKTNNPPEVQETLDRLTSRGLHENEAVMMICDVAGNEMFENMNAGGVLDMKIYVEKLKELV